MIGSQGPGNARYFCGRIRKTPVLVRFINHLGWHKEIFMVRGETRVRSHWTVSQRPGRSIYTCRKPMNHWRLTLKPQGTRWMNRIPVKNTVKRRQRPVFVMGKSVRVQVPTESWEIGHRYEFTRWEER